MRTMLDVSNDICGAVCPTSKPANGLDVHALQAILAACPADAVQRIERLERLIVNSKRDHHHSDDPWECCPKDDDSGMVTRSGPPECDCGADEWNAKAADVLGRDLARVGAELAEGTDAADSNAV